MKPTAIFDYFFFYEQQSCRSLYFIISLSHSAAMLRSIFNFLGSAQAQLRKTGQITSLPTSQSAVFAFCLSPESSRRYPLTKKPEDSG